MMMELTFEAMVHGIMGRVIAVLSIRKTGKIT